MRTRPYPPRAARLILVLSVLGTAGCCRRTICPPRTPCAATPPAAAATAPSGGGWTATQLWQGTASVQRVAIGDADPAQPGLEVVGVDEAGAVIVGWPQASPPTSREVARHGGRLTGLAVADLDPDVPGSEIYVGGYREADQGGAVVQVVLTPQGARQRVVYDGPHFVHAVARLEPAPGSTTPRLLVTDYDGAAFVATPAAGDGPWPAVEVYREPAETGAEDRKVKDAAVLRGAPGGVASGLFLALKGGRGVWVDPDRPGSGRLVHEEPGGMGRVAADEQGGVYLCGYAGRVVRLSRAGEGFSAAVLFTETVGGGGLRGIGLGRLPLPAGGRAELAIYGYSKVCRLLAPAGSALNGPVVYEDVERGHGLAVGDVVPGNDADEVVLGGYAKRITVLVHRAAGAR